MITGSRVGKNGLCGVLRNDPARRLVRVGATLRALTLIVVGGIGLLGLQGCSSESGAALDQGSASALHLSDNQRVAIEDLSERWLLMNYWASWCAPCIEEIPELAKLNERPDFKVVLYNFDRLQGQSLIDEAGKLKIELPMMLNEPAPLFELKSPSALPATLVVDRETGVTQWLMGAQTESGVLSKLGLDG